MEIKIRELCKSYGKKKALQNFDATFENGIYGILGPNGAGKSTLMNILTDNLLRDSGRILCGGKDILKWGAAYRKSLGYMPQQQQLYETFVGFVLTMIFYHDEKTGKTGEIDMKKNREKEDKIGKIEKFDKNESDKIDRKERKTEKISSPLKGEVIALSDVQDEAFSSGALGLGAAVDPKEGVLYAPADGTISVFFPTGHAIGMTTDDGVELLIHVGMDTVQLEGKGFRPFAKEGDRVTKGQKLLEFDMELICKEGYSLVTPVLITNTDEFSDISITSECHIDPQSILMTVTR